MARNADFYLERGLLSLKSRNYDGALVDLAKAIELNPEMHEAWVVRGNICNAQGRPFDALLHYDRALAVKPEASDIWNNRGLAFADLGNWVNAEYSYKQSIKYRDAIEPHMNLANLYAGLMRLPEAIKEYRAAIKFEPGNHEAHLNLGVTLLGMGAWKEGFEEYAWRHVGHPYPPRWQTEYPQWQGEDLTGKRIVLYPEQGLGDEIMGMRFAKMLADRYPNVYVILIARPACFTLAAQTMQEQGASAITVGSYRDLRDIRADYTCALLDVPQFLKLEDVDGLPHPYLGPLDNHDGRFDDLKARFDSVRGLIKVGLCWESGQRPLQPDTAATSANKSIPFAMLKPILEVPGVQFVSLQKEHTRGLSEFNIIDPMDAVHDLADTAAIIEELDLVISVDTAVAHLAGAMGKPVWNLVRYAGYWPWLHPNVTGDDAIWYRSMKLYRQPELFNWQAPIAQVTMDLLEMVEQRKVA